MTTRHDVRGFEGFDSAIIARRIRGVAVIAALCACALAAPGTIAAPVRYEVDPAHTEVTYTVLEFGFLPQRGRFLQTGGHVVLDREGGRADVEILVDATSFDSGWDLRDAFARSEVMLDATHHPVIRFASHGKLWREAAPKEIDGNLWLRGVEHAVVLQVAAFECDAATCHAVARAQLHRSDYGMARYAPFLGDDVELAFDVALQRTGD